MKVLIYIALHKRQEIAHLYYPALLRFMEDAEEVGELLIERGEAGSYYIITNESRILL